MPTNFMPSPAACGHQLMEHWAFWYFHGWFLLGLVCTSQHWQLDVSYTDGLWGCCNCRSRSPSLLLVLSPGMSESPPATTPCGVKPYTTEALWSAWSTNNEHSLTYAQSLAKPSPLLGAHWQVLDKCLSTAVAMQRQPDDDQCFTKRSSIFRFVV